MLVSSLQIIGDEMDESHSLVSHPGPLTNDRSLEAWTYIDPSYGTGWEKLFVAASGPGLWRLCNLPYHVFGLKVGAVLRVDQTGRISELVSNPSSPAFRLNLKDEGVREACLARLSNFIVEPMFTSFIGVQGAVGQQAEILNEAISSLMAEGLVLDTEDVMSSEFDPGPETTEPAEPGDGPTIHEPSGP